MSWAVAHQAPLSVEFSRKNTGVACHIWYTKVNSEGCEGYMESDKGGSFILIVFIYLFLIKRSLNFILFHSDISLNSSKSMKQKIKT